MFQHIEKHKRERHGAHSYSIGGDKKQATSTATSVADYSQVNTTTSTAYDLSDRSSHYNDLSSRTSNSNNTSASFWEDTSTRNSNNTSVTTIDTGTRITNTLDGGAIGGMAGVATGAIGSMAGVAMDAGKNALSQIAQAVGLATSVANGSLAAQVNAYDFADGLFSASQETVQAANTRAYNAWDRSAMMQESTLGAVQNAYADAKGTTQSQQQIMLAVVAVAGVAILAARRG